MAPGITEVSSAPPESASWKTCLCDLQFCSSQREGNTVHSIPSCLQGWIDIVRYSGLIDLVCSLGLPVLIRYAFGLSPRPSVPGDAGPPTPAGSGRRRAGHSRISPPIGLTDIVPNSPLPQAAGVATLGLAEIVPNSQLLAAAGVARPPTPAGAGQSSQSNPPVGLSDIVPNSPAAGVVRPPSPGVASSPSHGFTSLTCCENLVEIFAVSVNFPFVGVIDMFDGRFGQNIYQRKDWGREYKKFFFKKKKWLSSDIRHSALFEFEDKLVLTGPSRCMSAYGAIAILVVIPSTKKKDREICQLLWNVEYDLGMYNNPKTKCILTNRGSVYLTCAVVSNAVEAYVQVMLRLPCEAAVCAKVHGHINARIDTFNIGSTLFSKDVIDALDISISAADSLPHGHSHLEFCHPIILPLDRSVLVLPAGGYLQVKGELVFNGSNVVHVNHSIPIKEDLIASQWVQDNYCHTAVHITRW